MTSGSNFFTLFWMVMFGDQFFTCKSNTKSVRAILNCQNQGYKMVVRPHKIGAKAVELNQPQPSVSISWLSCFLPSSILVMIDLMLHMTLLINRSNTKSQQRCSFLCSACKNCSNIFFHNRYFGLFYVLEVCNLFFTKHLHILFKLCMLFTEGINQCHCPLQHC